MEAMELDSIVECYTETDMEQFRHDDVSDDTLILFWRRFLIWLARARFKIAEKKCFALESLKA